MLHIKINRIFTFTILTISIIITLISLPLITSNINENQDLVSFYKIKQLQKPYNSTEEYPNAFSNANIKYKLYHKNMTLHTEGYKLLDLNNYRNLVCLSEIIPNMKTGERVIAFCDKEQAFHTPSVAAENKAEHNVGYYIDFELINHGGGDVTRWI